MDMDRIEELEQERYDGLVEDIANFQELLSRSNFKDYDADSLAEMEISPYDEESLRKIHDAFCLHPELEQAYKEAFGRQSHERLYWAFHYADGNRYYRYLDTRFHLPRNDYYITDPCYIAKGNDWNENIWRGEDLSDLGIPTSFMRDTIFGDWSCVLLDDDTDEVLGEFGADAGLVVVAAKDEVLAYNPDFEKWAETHRWCVAEIHGFDGSFAYKVYESPYDEYGGGTEYVLTLSFNGTDEDGHHVSYIAGMF